MTQQSGCYKQCSFFFLQLLPVQPEPDTGADRDVHILFSRGHRWKRLRTTISPSFSKAKIKQVSVWAHDEYQLHYHFSVLSCQTIEQVGLQGNTFISLPWPPCLPTQECESDSSFSPVSRRFTLKIGASFEVPQSAVNIFCVFHAQYSMMWRNPWGYDIFNSRLHVLSLLVSMTLCTGSVGIGLLSMTKYSFQVGTADRTHPLHLAVLLSWQSKTLKFSHEWLHNFLGLSTYWYGCLAITFLGK